MHKMLGVTLTHTHTHTSSWLAILFFAAGKNSLYELFVLCPPLTISIMVNPTATTPITMASIQVAITTTVFSRIVMAVPGLIIPPVVITQLQRRTQLLKRFPRLELPIVMVITCAAVALATPLGCAIFPQVSSLDVDSLEPLAREKLAKAGHTGRVFFNKGL